MTSQTAVVEMTNIGKTFPGITALAGVNLSVQAGEVHAIVGENGAGKSTLMKILAGVYQPDSGSLRLNGSPVEFGSPVEAQRAGIRMVYQELNLVPDLTVAENISLGRMPTTWGVVDRGRMAQEAQKVLSELNTKIDPLAMVGDLTVSQQQLVEIAKAYAASPRLIVLDEPTSSLSEHEAQALFGVIAKMSDAGISVIYISHRLREVLEVADWVTVLRDGQHIDTRPLKDTTIKEMITLMVGRNLEEVFPKNTVPIGEIVLEVENLSSSEAFEGINLQVRAGEIVGLAGLVGAGRTEVAQALFGLRSRSQGRILIDGHPITVANPRQGIRAGIAYVPEDRKSDGIIPIQSIKNNISLAVLPAMLWFGFIKGRAERELAKQRSAELGVTPPLIDRLANTLSGGNQQKVVLAKWLAANPRVLILDEPTRGVDVGAKSDIHTIIGKLAEQGVAILMISSELPEILAVADRVYVLHEGKISAEIPRSEFSEEHVMQAATGEVGVRAS